MTMKYNESPDVTLKMIIDAGVLKPNIKVYALQDNKVEGVLNIDGSISVELDGEVVNFPFPSGAARALVKRSVNGWIIWKVLEEGEYRALSYYKELYKKEYCR